MFKIFLILIFTFKFRFPTFLPTAFLTTAPPSLTLNLTLTLTITLTLTLTIALTMTVLTFWSEMRWSEMKWAEKGVTLSLTFAGMYYFVEHTHMNFIQQVWGIYFIEYTVGIF